MAIKKVSAKTEVVEQPVKAVKSVKAVAAKVPVVKAEKPVVAAPAKKTVAAKAAVSETAAPKKETVKSVATKVTFSLPKEAVENAASVSVLGDFNNWQNGVSMKKQKDGSFAVSIELEKGRSYEYRFLINGEKWENAWNAEAYKPSPFGVFNSVVTA